MELQDAIATINTDVAPPRPAPPQVATPTMVGGFKAASANMVNPATDDRFTSQAIKEQGIGLSDELAQLSGLLGELAEFAIAADLDAWGNSIAVQRQQINLEAAQRAAQEDEEARQSVALDADVKRTRMRNPTEQQSMDCAWGAGAGTHEVLATEAAEEGASAPPVSDLPDVPVEELSVEQIMGKRRLGGPKNQVRAQSQAATTGASNSTAPPSPLPRADTLPARADADTEAAAAIPVGGR